MTPHRIRAAVPDPCGLPCVFYFPLVYPRATRRPKNRTAAAQRFSAHYALSLFKGGAVPPSSSSRIRPLSPCALSFLPPVFPPSPFSAETLVRRSPAVARAAQGTLRRSEDPRRSSPAVASGSRRLPLRAYAAGLLRQPQAHRSSGNPLCQRLRRLWLVSISQYLLTCLGISVLGALGYLSPLFLAFSPFRRSSYEARTWESCL
jgi:hypothetical protein